MSFLGGVISAPWAGDGWGLGNALASVIVSGTRVYEAPNVVALRFSVCCALGDLLQRALPPRMSPPAALRSVCATGVDH